MPLYEYHCTVCEVTFEALAALSDARRSRSCPRCGRRAPRVTSAFSIAAGSGRADAPALVSAAPAQKSGRPLCMRYPQLPLLCHMDQPSAERFVANVQGRGAQYDDTLGAREELRKKRGEPPAAQPSPAAHDHGHAHAHDHAHTHGHGHAHGGKQAHSHTHRHARHH